MPWNKVHFADDFGLSLCLKRHSRHNIREMIYEGKLASITECGFLLFHILANSNERNAIWPTTIPNKLSIFHGPEPQNTISPNFSLITIKSSVCYNWVTLQELCVSKSGQPNFWLFWFLHILQHCGSKTIIWYWTKTKLQNHLGS